MSEELRRAIVELDRGIVPVLVKRRLARGDDPLAILEECRRGMAIVGDRFQDGEYFLAELLLSAEIFKKAVAILDPHLARARSPEPTGKVVLATMRGDIHDLGKNIVATLLRVHAFEVHDLGVDVEPSRLVDEVARIEPDFVGFSALITTSFESAKGAVGLLEEAGLRDHVKLMVGGGVTTPELGAYLGADFQTRDASAGVAYCLETAGDR
jgi:methylmalonyl-CoA mutase cobalamin-binding domain/chain